MIVILFVNLEFLGLFLSGTPLSLTIAVVTICIALSSGYDSSKGLAAFMSAVSRLW